MLQYPKAYIGRYLLILRQVQIQRKDYDTRAVLCPNSSSHLPHAAKIKQHSTSVVIWEMSNTVTSKFNLGIHAHGLHAY